MKINYAIIGAGALGGVIAGSLLKVGCNVHLFARNDYEQIVNHGLTIIDKDSTQYVYQQVKVYNAIEKMPVCNVVILSVKSYANDVILPKLQSMLNPDSIIMILQNGIDIEKQVGQYYPQHLQIVTASWIKVFRNSPGVYQHIFGERVDAIEYAHSIIAVN